MLCGPGDWIETSTSILVVTKVLESDLVETYDLEKHTPQIVSTQRGCTMLACCHTRGHGILREQQVSWYDRTTQTECGFRRRNGGNYGL